MENRIESNEKLPTTETISADALKDLIYKNTGLPQDSRFLDFNDGGVFKYFFLRDLSIRPENKFYPLVKIEDKIIGLSELEKSPYQEKTFWVKFVSIDPEYQGKGHASKLVEEIFRFAKQEGIALEGSQRNEEGELKLKALFDRYADEFSVKYESQADKMKKI